MSEVRLATDEEEKRIGNLKTEREYDAILTKLLVGDYSTYDWRDHMVNHLKRYVSVEGFQGNYGSSFIGAPAAAYYLHMLFFSLTSMTCIKAIEGEVRQRVNTFGHIFGGPAYKVNLILRTKELSEALTQSQILIDTLKRTFPDKIVKSIKVEIAVLQEPDSDPTIEAAGKLRNEIGADASRALKSAIEESFEQSIVDWRDH